jgi:dipeptidyl aminopeptidase/acylaminoacyl peptidase
MPLAARIERVVRRCGVSAGPDAPWHSRQPRGRMVVTGWSYGSFMTTWLAGLYPVWKAAVAGAAVTDWVQMYDLSDGNVTQRVATGTSPYVVDGMAINRRQSPSNSATKIKAPTLTMCDTGDFRVPITQSYGLYRARWRRCGDASYRAGQRKPKTRCRGAHHG